MTTTTLTGFFRKFGDPSGKTLKAGKTTLSFVSETGSDGISYRRTDGDGKIKIAPVGNLYDVELSPGEADATKSYLFDVSWGGKHTVVLGLTNYKSDRFDFDYLFSISGDPLPNMSTVAKWNSWIGKMSFSETVTGTFGPGKKIAFSKFDNTRVTQDDEIPGTAGRDILKGGIGDDYFYSSRGIDTYFGGPGEDHLGFHRNDPSGIRLDLSKNLAIDGWGNREKVWSIENARGTFKDDTMIGNGRANKFVGLAGDDTLNGGGGRDYLRYDKDASYGGKAGVRVDLKAGTATDGFGDTDTVRNFEVVIGTAVRDVISGNGAANLLDGRGGNDTLAGRAGNDRLLGGAGRDALHGDGGADVLEGGRGRDLLTGGPGADTFVFGKGFGQDRITDFNAGSRLEKIDLSAIAAITGFRDLKAHHMTQSGDDVEIRAGGNLIILDDVAMGQLDASDFLF